VYGTKLGYLIVLFESFGVLQIPALLQSAFTPSLSVARKQSIAKVGQTWLELAYTLNFPKKGHFCACDFRWGTPLNDAFDKGFHQTKAHMHQQKYT
jgi:hypothetical protein